MKLHVKLFNSSNQVVATMEFHGFLPPKGGKRGISTVPILSWLGAATDDDYSFKGRVAIAAREADDELNISTDYIVARQIFASVDKVLETVEDVDNLFQDDYQAKAKVIV